MSSQEKAPSNLEVLIREKVLPDGTSLEDATEELLTELNCVECIAAAQCADCYGEVTVDTDRPRCREVIMAYLRQDHIKKEDK